jgi:hypothetical protein
MRRYAAATADVQPRILTDASRITGPVAISGTPQIFVALKRER